MKHSYSINLKNFTTILFFVSFFLTGSLSYGQGYSEDDKIVASDMEPSDTFGSSVAISDSFAIVGTPFDDENVLGTDSLTNSGSAYFYKQDGAGNWNEVQKIVASDRDSLDLFGTSVSISDSFAIIGSPFDDDNALGTDSLTDAGSAYIFKRDGAGNWSEVQKIVAMDRGENANFGYSVSISGDYLIVGARNEDQSGEGGDSLYNAGAAYIFEKDASGTWNQVWKLDAFDREESDNFGSSVAISGDYAIVGAVNEDDDFEGTDSISGAGSAYIFEKQRDNWIQVNKLTATDTDIGSDREENAGFGSSVAISGNFAIVGAPNEDGNYLTVGEEIDAGAAYIFEKIGGGWTEVKNLVASDRTASDNFGSSVAISGKSAVVGARMENEDANGTNALNNAGSGYIIRKGDDRGTWDEIQKIDASDREELDVFGSSVAMSNNTIIVGAPENDDAGSAYIFSCTPTTGVDTRMECGSLTWIDGNTYLTNNNTATFTLTNADGCDSIVTLDLTIITNVPNTTVARNGDSLMSNATGVTYQWVNCNTGNSPIAGETNALFVPTSNGSYAVIVTNSDCSAMSACFSITSVGIEENASANKIKLFPNPTKDLLTIETKKIDDKPVMTVYSVIGEKIIQQRITESKTILDLSGYKQGIYFVRIGDLTKRIIKQ